VTLGVGATVVVSVVFTVATEEANEIVVTGVVAESFSCSSYA
jgi:hypothetical protein